MSVVERSAMALPAKVATRVAVGDDLSRSVYCILGLPIDAIDMASALKRIQVAASSAAGFVISTPNLDFCS
jgi:N-acetylglucosaminyldiphosphoundecaprenol N-acetyl-beta-D-mannosaminyltransferase